MKNFRLNRLRIADTYRFYDFPHLSKWAQFWQVHKKVTNRCLFKLISSKKLKVFQKPCLGSSNLIYQLIYESSFGKVFCHVIELLMQKLLDNICNFTWKLIELLRNRLSASGRLMLLLLSFDSFLNYVSGRRLSNMKLSSFS